MRVWSVAAVLLLALTPVAYAAPLDLKQVSGEAKWIVHLDVDAMRDSQLVQSAYNSGVSLWPEAELYVELACQRLEMSPEVDLHGITVYGNRIGKLEGVIIVYADVNQRLLVDKVKASSGYRSAKHGACDVHCWTDGQHALAGAFFKPSVVVFGQTEAEVAAALDVLEAKSPALTGKDSALAAAIPTGTMLLARGVGLADADLPLKSPLVKQSEGLSIAIGEHQGEFFAIVGLTVKSADVAQRVKTVVEGARAAAELQWGSDPQAMKIVGLLKLEQSDKTVQVQLRASADEAWMQIQKAWRQVAKLR